MKIDAHFELSGTRKFSEPRWWVRVRATDLSEEAASRFDQYLRLFADSFEVIVRDGAREYVGTYPDSGQAGMAILAAELIAKEAMVGIEIRFGVDFTVTPAIAGDVPLCCKCGRPTQVDERELQLDTSRHIYTHQAVLRCRGCRGTEIRRLRWTLFGKNH